MYVFSMDKHGIVENPAVLSSLCPSQTRKGLQLNWDTVLLSDPPPALKGRFHMQPNLILPFLTVSLASCAVFNSHSGNPETSVCGPFKEPFVFWLWSRSAGEANPLQAQQIKNAEAIKYKTADGRVLRGYKLKHAGEDGVARGSVLLAQGNAMLADQILPTITSLSEAGIDVYLFDYRGYGQSEGKRRLKAIVSDYKEIFENLLPKNTGKRFLYGISFGGIVVSNVIGSGIQFDRAVIDSSPSRLSNHGCEEKYDPLVNIPTDASNILVIAGDNDHIVKPADSLELRTAIEQHGGTSVFRTDFAHPFMDSPETHLGRTAIIKRYLLEEKSE